MLRSSDHRGNLDDPGLVVSNTDADEWERAGLVKDNVAGIKRLDEDEWRICGRPFPVNRSYCDKVSSNVEGSECQVLIAMWVPIYRDKSNVKSGELIVKND